MFSKKKNDIIIDEKRKRGHYGPAYPMEMGHREILQKEVRHYSTPFLMYAFGWSVWCGTITFFLLREDVGFALANFAIFALVSLVTLGIGLTKEIQFQLDLSEGAITSVDGRVWTHIEGTRREEKTTRLEVDGAYFTLPKAQLGDFVNGQRYRVYYAPYTKIIVGSELI
jgi:hypothetical protein